jgi:NADH-quinone oxidoreductase subunit G
LDFGVAPHALAGAGLVIAATTHLPESLRPLVHVVLPIGSFAETSGTFVNAEGRWQSWAGAAKALGESRPGWKVLRVIANMLKLHGVDYVSSDEIRDALKMLCGSGALPGAGAAAMPHGYAIPKAEKPVGAWMDIPPYQCDALVRGSEALSKTRDGRMARTVI